MQSFFNAVTCIFGFDDCFDWVLNNANSFFVITSVMAFYILQAFPQHKSHIAHFNPFHSFYNRSILDIVWRTSKSWPFSKNGFPIS